MREVSCRLEGRRYRLPIAVLRPGSVIDLTSFAAIALVDTGATTSGIGPRVIEDLGLHSYGKKLLRSASDEVFVSYFLFRIGFYSDEQIASPAPPADDLPFTFEETDGFSWRRPADFDVILGMDVLSQCDVSMDRAGRCRIRFG